ncbi:MAG: hypothetical protein AB1324_03580 [Candidatus Micrarchaeota archaeon]
MTGSTMKKRENITQIINQILEQATRTRQGFTPDVLRQFEDEAQRAREERQRNQVREATPVRQERREERREAAVIPLRTISPEMRQRGIENAVDLGERIEMASAEASDAAALRKLNFRRDWGREAA